jgi:WD40 repeat protein
MAEQFPNYSRLYKSYTKDGKILTKTGGHRDCIISLAWNAEGRKLASGSVDNSTKIWNLGKNVSNIIYERVWKHPFP